MTKYDSIGKFPCRVDRLFTLMSEIRHGVKNDFWLSEQDGVLHAHALLVWGKCSRRLSELHTGFTDFSFFRYFSHGST